MRLLDRRQVVPDLVANSEAMLQARSLTIRRGAVEVLRDVELAIVPGELTALVGPNGAGKSTLLAALAGDLRPAAGTVELCGRDISQVPAAQLALSRSMLTQSVEMSFPFTVTEVVAMGRAPWAKVSEADRDVDDETVVRECMALMQVEHLAGRSFPSLSGGERARVALARVLAQRTALVLLDEPTAALDIGQQEQVFAILRALVDQGSTVVVVVHDLALAARWTDRVVLMQHGTVLAHGSPEAVMTPELLSRVYNHDLVVAAHPLDGSLLIAPRSPVLRSRTERTQIYTPTSSGGIQ